ncbi:MAG: thermonuclease family protein [Parasphingopyxis sp.]
MSSQISGQCIIIGSLGDDRYGRLVARLYLADGRDINRLLIETGAAREYCSYSQNYYGRCD